MTNPVSLAEVIEFMERRCVGVDQSADEARWKLIRLARAHEPTRDAEDAARWRFAKEQMNYSFDGENRTHYMKAEGRENFEETIDRRRGSSENRK